MKTTTKRLWALPVLGLAAVAGLAGPAAATGTAPGRSARQGFVIVAGEFGTGSGRLIMTGAIRGIGTDTVTAHVANADGTFTDTDRFDLPDGQVELTDTYSVDITFDATSCRYRIGVRGSWSISGSTGDYTGATGSGTFTAHGLIVTGRDSTGVCIGLDAVTEPIAYTEVAHGTGTVTLP